MSLGVTTYPVMLIGYQAGVGVDGAWGHVADEPPEQGDEIVISHTSGGPGGDSMVVSVKSVGENAPFTITATMIA
jgi:hypothetical protein